MAALFLSLLLCSSILLVVTFLSLKANIHECVELHSKLDCLREKLRDKNKLLEKKGSEIKRLKTELYKPKNKKRL